MQNPRTPWTRRSTTGMGLLQDSLQGLLFSSIRASTRVGYRFNYMLHYRLTYRPYYRAISKCIQSLQYRHRAPSALLPTIIPMHRPPPTTAYPTSVFLATTKSLVVPNACWVSGVYVFSGHISGTRTHSYVSHQRKPFSCDMHPVRLYLLICAADICSL